MGLSPYVTTEADLAAPPPPGEHDLAAFVFGASPVPSSDSLVVPIPLHELLVEDGGPAALRWTSDRPARRFERFDFACAATREHVVGWSRVPARDAAAAAYSIYERLLSLVLGGDHPHLLRVWNVLPRINAEDAGSDGVPLERYRGFCRGRAEAFERALGPDFGPGLPAASAVGSRGGEDLVVAFVATRAETTPAENPRQLAAWRYPRRYGPRPPSFARAAHEAGAPTPLFLSGTASIVGHESVHPGDVVAQTRETIQNLDTLCARAAGDSCAPGFLQVFVRHAADAPAVRAELTDHYGTAPRLVLLEADICRSELLVEVEGVGTPVATPAP